MARDKCSPFNREAIRELKELKDERKDLARHTQKNLDSRNNREVDIQVLLRAAYYRALIKNKAQLARWVSKGDGANYPGDPARVEIYAQRVLRGKPIHQPFDRRYYGK